MSSLADMIIREATAGIVDYEAEAIRTRKQADEAAARLADLLDQKEAALEGGGPAPSQKAIDQARAFAEAAEGVARTAARIAANNFKN